MYDILPFVNDNSKEDTGYIVRLVKCLLNGCKRFTPLGLFECARKTCKTTSRSVIETYILSNLFLLLVINFLVLPFPIPNIFKYLFTFLACWRLYDILITAIRLTFFRHPKCDKKDPIPERSLICITINYIEIILIFSILYFTFFNQYFISISDSLLFSFEVFVPIVSPCPDAFQIAGWLFIIEIIVSLIIHTTIIQRILASFKK